MKNNIIKDYKKQGYLLLRDFWDPKEIEEIHLQAKHIFLKQIQNLMDCPKHVVADDNAFDKLMFNYFNLDVEGFINCGKQVQHLISLHKLSVDDRLLKLLKSIGLDFPIISVRPSMFFNSRNLDKTGHYWRLDAHQDWRSSQGSLDSVTLWFPYVKCNKELGALEVIPQSHLWGLLECEKVDYYSKIKVEIDDTKFLSIEMESGDLLIFSSFLVHRSGTNTTQKIRWSTQLRYSNIEEATFVQRKFPNPFTYKPFEDLVTLNFPSKEDLGGLFLNK